MSNKIQRFINSFKGIQPGRKGKCTPDKCSTLSGEKGSACCKLEYKCPMLCGTACKVYPIRPGNCIIFPRSPEDLKLVRNCGYYW